MIQAVKDFAHKGMKHTDMKHAHVVMDTLAKKIRFIDMADVAPIENADQIDDAVREMLEQLNLVDHDH